MGILLYGTITRLYKSMVEENILRTVLIVESQLKISPCSASKHTFLEGEELPCTRSGMQWIKMLLRSYVYSVGIQDAMKQMYHSMLKLQAPLGLLELHAILKVQKAVSLPCAQMQAHTASKLRTHELNVSTDGRFGR